MRKLLLLIFLMNAFFSVKSKNAAIDSLEILVNGNVEDTLKVLAFSELCWEYRFIDQQKALEYGFEGINLARKSKYKFGEGKALNDLSIIYMDMGKLDTAIVLLEDAGKIRSSLNDKQGEAAIYNKLGIIYEHRFMLEEALSEHLKALKIYEELDIKPNIGFCLNNIGNVHFKLGNFEKALEIHNQALEVRTAINDEYGIAGSHANMGNAYMRMQDSTLAVFHFNTAIDIYRKRQNLSELAVVLNNLGAIFLQQQKYKDAEVLLTEAIEVREKLNDARGLSTTKNLIGELYARTGKLQLAEKSIREALNISLESGYKQAEKEAYKNFALLYKQAGNIDSSYYYHTRYIDFIEEEYQTNLNEKVTELQTIYETEKKEKEIELQQLQIDKQNADLSRRNIMLVSSAVLILIILLLAYLIYNRQKLKEQNLVTELALKEELARKKLQEKIGEERLRISRDLHDSLGAELTLISSSADTMAMTSEDENLQKAFYDISDISRNSANILRDTIWAIRKDSLDVDEFEMKLQQFVQQRKSAVNVEIDNKISQRVSLSPGQSLHLFRVCQEAVHNAIKHAKCSVMTIVFSASDEKIEVKIKDDGVGFESGGNTGYGLNNMKERIEEINGSFRIESKTGIGTEIFLSIPRKL